MPSIRSKQLALAAAYLGTDSEHIIQSSITAMLLSLCSADKAFAAVLLRSSGVEWDDLASADSTDVLAKLLP
jgi:hypothetical protein